MRLSIGLIKRNDVIRGVVEEAELISHRRRGIARQLMQRSIEMLPAKRYILEVIETNERAASLYRELGFIETRRFQAWKYQRKEGSAPPSPSKRRQAASLQDIRNWCDFAPSWQNDIPSIRRAREPYIVIGDEDGAVIVFLS